jgi:C_GCAxxG_C_C family probable redox protein
MKENVMNLVEHAVEAFGEGKNCAQAIVSVFGPGFGLEEDKALAVSLPFGGGIGGTGRTCGAITGSLMVLGLRCAAMGGSDSARKQRACTAARDFLARFEAGNGARECRDLLGCDISTPEGMKTASSSGMFKSLCPGFICDAATILANMIEENADERTS